MDKSYLFSNLKIMIATMTTNARDVGMHQVKVGVIVQGEVLRVFAQ